MLFMFHVCHAVLSVPCSLLVTCWERNDFLALLFYFAFFVTFPFGVLDQVWYFIASIPDLCMFPNFIKCREEMAGALK